MTPTLAESRQLPADHGALALIEMPAMQIERHHKRERIGTTEFFEVRLNVFQQASVVSIAAIEDHALEPPNRLTLSVRKHILAEVVHLLVGHHREDVRERMESEFHLNASLQFGGSVSPITLVSALHRCGGKQDLVNDHEVSICPLLKNWRAGSKAADCCQQPRERFHLGTVCVIMWWTTEANGVNDVKVHIWPLSKNC
jgi:hypothetical protein